MQFSASLFDVELGENHFVEVLQVGRPAQEMRVVFDTGSGNLVLPAAECLDIHLGHMAFPKMLRDVSCGPQV